MVEFEGLPPAGRVFNFDPEPQIHRKDISPGEVLLWRKIQDQLNIAGFAIQDIYTLVSGGLIGLAYKELTIAATDLIQTVVANDTLIVVSATGHKFNWKDGRLEKCRSVMLEPALGVPEMGFVMDTAAHIGPAILHSVDAAGDVTHNLQMDCVTPVPADKTHLQRRQWSNVSGDWDLDPAAWEVGQTVHLTQLRIVEATELI